MWRPQPCLFIARYEAGSYQEESCTIAWYNGGGANHVLLILPIAIIVVKMSIYGLFTFNSRGIETPLSIPKVWKSTQALASVSALIH